MTEKLNLPAVENPSPPSKTTKQECVSATLNSLANWTPGETVPEGLSSTTIATAIEGIAAKQAPASKRQILSGVAKLLRHARAFNIQVDAASLEGVYLTECRTFPAALFDDAVSAILHRWNNDFHLPTPAALWEMVDTEHERLMAEMSLLQKALRARREQDDAGRAAEVKMVTPEQAAEILDGIEVTNPALRAALARLGDAITKRQTEDDSR